MENIFILPGNEQELFNRYLDNNEYGPLKERLELVRKALSNKLSPDERNKHGLNVGVHELSMERKELERKIFQMALKSFAERVCDEQRALCEHIPLRRKGGYLLHALAQLFTVRRFLRKSDILMKSILHIWKILMWAIVPGSLDMRTGMCQLHWSIM